MKVKIAAVVAVLMLPVFFGFILVTPAQGITTLQPDVTWLKGTIDNKSTTQQWLSETVDPSGFVHISYYDSGLAVLMYANNVGGVWKTEQFGTTNNGMYSSIAADRFGVIHLAYFDSANNKIYYAHRTASTSWSSPVSFDSGGKYVSMAVDVNGVVHIAYQDANNQKVMYADNTGGVWSSPVVVDNTGISGQGISIGTDNNGKCYISYYESVNSQLRFATNANGNWVNEQVAGTGLVAPFTAISMNNVSGSVTIVYYDQTNHKLKSVTGTTSQWGTPLTIDSVIGASCASIVMDSSLDLNVAYYDKSNATLKYAKETAGAWMTYVVDTGVYSNGVLSIDIDSYNKIHVAYMSSSSHLLYATSSGAKWAWSALETVGDVGIQNAMVIDTAGYTHIVYIDQTNPTNHKLVYVSDASGSWQDELIANHASSPSIALSSNGKVYVSYHNDSGTLRYATTDANGAWVENIVDTGDVGSVSSITVGGNGTLFIAYRDDANKNLLVAEYVNGSKSINPRDTDQITGTSISIALDGGNHVYVLYNTTQGLKMVTNKDVIWLTSIIDPHASSGMALSMLIDSANRIQISYFDLSTNELVYRNYTGSAWSAKDIVLSNVQISGSSLVMNSKGLPRIAVSLSQNSVNSLRVMEKIGGVWMSSDVETLPVGADVSMAVDKYDRYHMIYYGEYSGDLLSALSITSPTIPTNVNGTRGDQFVRLTWSTSTSNGGSEITKYLIYRGEASGLESIVNEVSGSALVYNDTGVDNSKVLYYKVVAVNSEGSSVASSEFSVNAYSNPTANDSSLMILLIVGVIAVVVIAVAVILVMRKVKPKSKWKQ
jgi:hypothetical protein